MSVVKNRVFVRYKHKYEAETALYKFADRFKPEMAKEKNRAKNKNKDKKGVPPSVEEKEERQKVQEDDLEEKPEEEKVKRKEKPEEEEKEQASGSRESQDVASGSRKSCLQENYHLILGNLPKGFTIDKVRDFVQEANPIAITNMDETKAFRQKFCHVVLNTEDDLNYLIEKLHGFVLGGQKLIAVEANNLIKWKRDNF